MSHAIPSIDLDSQGEPKNSIGSDMHSHACACNLAAIENACMSHARPPIGRSQGDAQTVEISAMHALNH